MLLTTHGRTTLLELLRFIRCLLVPSADHSVQAVSILGWGRRVAYEYSSHLDCVKRMSHDQSSGSCDKVICTPWGSKVTSSIILEPMSYYWGVGEHNYIGWGIIYGWSHAWNSRLLKVVRASLTLASHLTSEPSGHKVLESVPNIAFHYPNNSGKTRHCKRILSRMTSDVYVYALDTPPDHVSVTRYSLVLDSYIPRRAAWGRVNKTNRKWCRKW